MKRYCESSLTLPDSGARASSYRRMSIVSPNEPNNPARSSTHPFSLTLPSCYSAEALLLKILNTRVLLRFRVSLLSVLTLTAAKGNLQITGLKDVRNGNGEGNAREERGCLRGIGKGGGSSC